jgi:hypothetical protein
MDEGYGVADLFVLKRSKPSRLTGWIACNPRSDGLNDQNLRAA